MFITIQNDTKGKYKAGASRHHHPVLPNSAYTTPTHSERCILTATPINNKTPQYECRQTEHLFYLGCS